MGLVYSSLVEVRTDNYFFTWTHVRYETPTEKGAKPPFFAYSPTEKVK